ncbi:MAG: hypothetical protein MUO34_13165 [Ignavibacteriaceae bacterium]|nr:hypothetical protein [Ignavibacteriaceae bacterium]
MKKFFALFTFLFIPLVAILFVQCNEPVIEPTDQDMVLSLNKGGGVEVVLNHLSFPALLADGYTLTPIDETLWGVAYTGPYTGLTAEEIAWLAANGPWYAQKVDENVWQAQYTELTALEDVSFIDWGDNIESFSPKVGQPFRLEVTLYKELLTPMTAYTMALLANPSSPDEIQGTNTVTYDGYLATIASDKAKLVIQKYTTAPTVWNGSSWDGADVPVAVSFGVELNVGGKLIFGASSGGWKPKVEGNYRITYYLPGSVEVNLSNAVIGPAPTDQVAFPVVDAGNNLTYVDIVVVPKK